MESPNVQNNSVIGKSSWLKRGIVGAIAAASLVLGSTYAKAGETPQSTTPKQEAVAKYDWNNDGVLKGEDVINVLADHVRADKSTPLYTVDMKGPERIWSRKTTSDSIDDLIAAREEDFVPAKYGINSVGDLFEPDKKATLKVATSRKQTATPITAPVPKNQTSTYSAPAKKWTLLGKGGKKLSVGDTDGDGRAVEGNDAFKSFAKSAVGGNRVGNEHNIYANQHFYGISNDPFTGKNRSKVLSLADIARDNKLSYASIDVDGDKKADIEVSSLTYQDLQRFKQTLAATNHKATVLSETKRGDKITGSYHSPTRKAMKEYASRKSSSKSGYQRYKVPTLAYDADMKLAEHVGKVYQLAKDTGVIIKSERRTEDGQHELIVRDFWGAKEDLAEFERRLPELGVQYGVADQNKGPGRGKYFLSERVYPKRGDASVSKRYGQKGQNVKIDDRTARPLHFPIQKYSDDFVILGKDHGANWTKRHGDESVVIMKYDDYKNICGENYQLKKGGDLFNAAMTTVASGNVAAGAIDLLFAEAGDLEKPTAYRFSDSKSAFDAFNKLVGEAHRGHKFMKLQNFGIDMDGNGTPEFNFAYALGTNNCNRDQLQTLDDVMYVNQNKCGIFKDALIRAAAGVAYRNIPTGDPKTPTNGGGITGGQTGGSAGVVPPTSGVSGGAVGSYAGSLNYLPR